MATPFHYAIAALITLTLLPITAHCFHPLTYSIFGRLYNNIEGYIARQKVNADLITTMTKYPNESDDKYSYATTSPKVDHSLWNELMKKHVSPGVIDGITTNVVNYQGMAADQDVPKYLQVLANANLADMESHPNELKALYINAYNCLCIGHVTRYMKENGGGTLPSSVTKTIPPSSDKKEIWDVEAGVVGGQTVSLNDIEHKILRSKWDDPRIHASIVCASASCPNLRAEAFLPYKLNVQMNDQASTWVGDVTKGVKVVEKGDQTFSRIFLWFEGDFKSSGGVIAWVKKYLENESEASILDDGGDLEMKYFTYNWNLNKK
uniref:DUF547 domain-containing protein n=1 Tax=Ditylum brightwellii TaxID=49249 RepID=A0A7S1ZK83_9STRA